MIHPFWDNLSTTEVCFRDDFISQHAIADNFIITYCLISVHCLLPSSVPLPLLLLLSPLYPMCVSLLQMSSSVFSPSCSKLYLLWCRMLSSERQYVAVLKGVEETYLPLLELSDTPASIRGKADALFPNWASLGTFHSQNLLPAMEGALVQSLLQQDCFSKYVSEGLRTILVLFMFF